ncbi:DUF4168 domain-containing protein [Szabonella alba]|uniref:DUF4168 domain-containing protein n=1 Tax=Szabonella alba TaxID=2804194 RepID=A0A8K0VFD3_9RHOB|nr:DUF4168 domain-containing protein [Szabonella alba]MBL4919258.1 DUF4168 domain-containing protein [Szabonella alba]
MKLSGNLKTLAVVGLMGSAMPFAVPALAQQDAPATSEVSETEIDAFVTAYRGVNQVYAEYEAPIAEAGDEASQTALQQEAQQKMNEVIDETPGIDLDRYVTLLNLAQTDEQMRAIVVAKLEE